MTVRAQIDALRRRLGGRRELCPACGRLRGTPGVTVQFSLVTVTGDEFLRHFERHDAAINAAIESAPKCPGCGGCWPHLFVDCREPGESVPRWPPDQRALAEPGGGW